jgi:site-specific recombinase XerD
MTTSHLGFQTASQPRSSRRQYLTEKEVTQLCDAARARGRWGHRDATMILIAYRHGLRVSELVALTLQKLPMGGVPTV